MNIAEIESFLIDTCRFTHHASTDELPLLEELWEELDRFEPLEDVFKPVMVWVRFDRGELRTDEEREKYTEEYYWYQLQARRSEHMMDLAMNSHYFLKADKDMDPPIGEDYERFMRTLIDAVKQTVEWQQDDMHTYDRMISRMPNRNRAGLISRSELWDMYPEFRIAFYEGASMEFCTDLLDTFDLDREEGIGFIEDMTARDYFGYAKMCYDALELDGSDMDAKADRELTPRELFYLYHDGRDDGLRDIDEDDPAAFKEWATQACPDHRFEIIGSRLRLIPEYCGDKGCRMNVWGNIQVWRWESAKAFLALRKNNIPAMLSEQDDLEDMMYLRDNVYFTPMDGYDIVNGRSFLAGERVLGKMLLDNVPRDRRYRMLVDMTRWAWPAAGCRLKK